MGNETSGYESRHCVVNRAPDPDGQACVVVQQPGHVLIDRESQRVGGRGGRMMIGPRVKDGPAKGKGRLVLWWAAEGREAVYSKAQHVA